MGYTVNPVAAAKPTYIGCLYRAALCRLGEYNFAAQNTLAAGLSFEFPFSSRSVTQ
jgi:hypothetical protein